MKWPKNKYELERMLLDEHGEGYAKGFAAGRDSEAKALEAHIAGALEQGRQAGYKEGHDDATEELSPLSQDQANQLSAEYDHGFRAGKATGIDQCVTRLGDLLKM